MANETNRRRHSRVISSVEARLKSPHGVVFTGHTKDLSHSGVYIRCTDPVFISSAKECLLKLIFPEKEGLQEVGFKCKCVRTDQDGFAVEFLAIRREDAEYFKQKLEQLSDSAQTMRSEYQKCPYPPQSDVE